MNRVTETNHVEVCLELYGFQDITHEEISTRLGLEPTRIYVQGQPQRPGIARLSRENRWLFQTYTEAGPWLDIEQQLDQLLNVASTRWEAFGALAGYCKGIEVKCAVFIYFDNGESTPPVYLERRHVNMLAKLGAAFDVDLYTLPASENNE